MLFTYKNLLGSHPCTMIMQPASQPLDGRKAHDRMPCVLSQAQALIWLDRSLELKTSLNLLRPVEDGVLERWAVDKKVNNARNKGLDNPDIAGPQLTLY